MSRVTDLLDEREYDKLLELLKEQEYKGLKNKVTEIKNEMLVSHKFANEKAFEYAKNKLDSFNRLIKLLEIVDKFEELGITHYMSVLNSPYFDGKSFLEVLSMDMCSPEVEEKLIVMAVNWQRNLDQTQKRLKRNGYPEHSKENLDIYFPAPGEE